MPQNIEGFFLHVPVPEMVGDVAVVSVVLVRLEQESYDMRCTMHVGASGVCHAPCTSEQVDIWPVPMHTSKK